MRNKRSQVKFVLKVARHERLRLCKFQENFISKIISYYCKIIFMFSQHNIYMFINIYKRTNIFFFSTRKRLCAIKDDSMQRITSISHRMNPLSFLYLYYNAKKFKNQVKLKLNLAPVFY